MIIIIFRWLFCCSTFSRHFVARPCVAQPFVARLHVARRFVVQPHVVRPIVAQPFVGVPLKTHTCRFDVLLLEHHAALIK